MANGTLGPNELAVLAAASRIFGGLAETARSSNENHKKAFDYSLRVAFAMAKTIDKSTVIQNIVDTDVASFAEQESLGGEVPFPW